VLGAKQGCKANKPSKARISKGLVFGAKQNANSLQVVKTTKYLAVC
jgi:hypothetical protein